MFSLESSETYMTTSLDSLPYRVARETVKYLCLGQRLAAVGKPSNWKVESRTAVGLVWERPVSYIVWKLRIWQLCVTTKKNPFL